MQDYEDIKSEYNKTKKNITHTLVSLEETLIEGRDEEKIPIYLTKWRIKSSESIYLKIKRKPLSLIHDRGGMRVLCLFEQDIMPTFGFIIKKIKELGYKLNEVIVYNWESKEDLALFEEITNYEFIDACFKSEPKDSGYKSVHFIATNKISGVDYSIEIQLRTLLQDVWGELEHSLSYKQGNIHPHIKKSFSLLANDLQTNDKLITHLRDISDKEKNVTEFILEDKKPTAVFAYEDDLVSDLFKESKRSNLLSSYDEYIEAHWSDNDTSWINEAKSLYERIEDTFTSSDRKKPQIKYWLDSESAFLLFANKEYDLALSHYEDIAKKNIDRYVPQFRIGEIELLRSNVEKSLPAFDRCEKLLIMETNSANKTNVYLVKSILANIYWQLGEEYTHLSVKEIQEAEKLYLDNKRGRNDFFTTEKKTALINNMCYYLLEDYILATEKCNLTSCSEEEKIREDKFIDLKKRFDDLEEMINTVEISTPNAYDTAAWFCYHAHLKGDGSNDWLNKAYDFCKKSWKKSVVEDNLINNANIRRIHTQEIRAAMDVKYNHFT